MQQAFHRTHTLTRTAATTKGNKKRTHTSRHCTCALTERISHRAQRRIVAYEFSSVLGRLGSLLCGSIRMLPFYMRFFTLLLIHLFDHCFHFDISVLGNGKNYGVAVVYVLIVASIPIFLLLFFVFSVSTLCLFVIISFYVFIFIYLFVCLRRV